MAKMRDRILQTALALFNEEGACGMSAVELAAAIEISPGHLYYHFKGKREIIATLFDVYEIELGLVIEAAMLDLLRGEAGIETMGVHVHILLEEADDVCFLFRETGALIAQMPELAVRYRRVMAATEMCVSHMLSCLAGRGIVSADAESLKMLVRTVALGLAFKLRQLELEGGQRSSRERIARAAAEIMTLPAAFASS